MLFVQRRWKRLATNILDVCVRCTRSHSAVTWTINIVKCSSYYVHINFDRPELLVYKYNDRCFFGSSACWRIEAAGVLSPSVRPSCNRRVFSPDFNRKLSVFKFRVIRFYRVCWFRRSVWWTNKYFIY